jgi:hypothetical protein
MCRFYMHLFYVFKYIFLGMGVRGFHQTLPEIHAQKKLRTPPLRSFKSHKCKKFVYRLSFHSPGTNIQKVDKISYCIVKFTV